MYDQLDLPHVLVIGPTFNTKTGTGITVSNLFNGWDIDKLYSLSYSAESPADNICQYFFAFKKEDRYPPFFVKMIRWVVTSKSKSLSSIDSLASRIDNSGETLTKLPLLYKTFKKLKTLVNLKKFRLTPSLKLWLQGISPDLIYAIYSDIETMNFVLAVQNYLQKPLVVHIMDDWISVPLHQSVLHSYKEKRRCMLFTKLINQADVRLAISEFMAEEYQQRYKKEFKTVHNYIDINVWKRDLQTVRQNECVIGYFGTINLKNITAIRDVIMVVGQNPNIRFRIFSKQSELLKKQFVGINNLEIYESVETVKYHEEIHKCSILLMPLDFSKESISYTRLSMPTKFIEYMGSCVPILVYAPPETALVKFAKKHGTAKVVTDPDQSLLANAITQLLENDEERYSIVTKAYALVAEHYNQEIVTRNFRKFLIESISPMKTTCKDQQ